MPLDTRSDGPQLVPAPGAETFAKYVPGQLASASLDLVERIQRHFVTALETDLSEALQVPVAGTLHQTHQLKYSAILDRAEAGGCLIALDLAPLRGYVLIDFPPPLLFRVLDILLASPSDAVAGSRGGVTEIELHILREFFDIFIKSLRDAWAPVYPVGLKLLSTGIEETRQALVTGTNEMALATSVGLSIGDVQTGFEIAVPGFLARLAEIHSREHTSRDSSQAPVQESLIAALGKATVRLEAVLQGASVRMEISSPCGRARFFCWARPRDRFSIVW